MTRSTCIALACAAVLLGGCAKKDSDQPSAVEDTVHTMTQYNKIKAGQRAKERIRQINDDRTADRREVGLD